MHNSKYYSYSKCFSVVTKNYRKASHYLHKHVAELGSSFFLWSFAVFWPLPLEGQWTQPLHNDTECSCCSNLTSQLYFPHAHAHPPPQHLNVRIFMHEHTEKQLAC